MNRCHRLGCPRRRWALGSRSGGTHLELESKLRACPYLQASFCSAGLLATESWIRPSGTITWQRAGSMGSGPGCPPSRNGGRTAPQVYEDKLPPPYLFAAPWTRMLTFEQVLLASLKTGPVPRLLLVSPSLGSASIPPLAFVIQYDRRHCITSHKHGNKFSLCLSFNNTKGW